MSAAKTKTPLQRAIAYLKTTAAKGARKHSIHLRLDPSGRIEVSIHGAPKALIPPHAVWSKGSGATWADWKEDGIDWVAFL